MDVGDRIRKLRLSIDMTQEELGEALGVQKSVVAKYENGKVQNIKRTTLLKMAKLFDCSPCYIMGFEDEVDLAKEEYDRLYYSLDADDRESVRIFMKGLLEKDKYKKFLDQIDA